MKTPALLLTWFLMGTLGCSDPESQLVYPPAVFPPLSPGPNDLFIELSMECVDMVSMGGTLQTVVNTQDEYDQLIYDRFTRPLQDYWSRSYQSILESVKQRYPGLSDNEYARLVREIFYSVLPFRGTEDCLIPEIDFVDFTLLGQDVHAGGCTIPDYEIGLARNDSARSITYSVKITEHGSCSMAISRNKWILTRKIPDDYSVLFEKEYIRN